MHPALSVIFFTAVSGTGYGLLFLLGLVLAVDPRLCSRTEALSVLVIGSVFAIAGLASSLLHLGQPQRAWRALSQWRSSWLSREGLAALITFVPAAGIAFAFIMRDAVSAFARLDAAALAVLAVITVLCTAKIYTSLKTVPAWHNRLVLPGYLLFALLGGSAWFAAVDAIVAGRDADWRIALVVAILAAWTAVLKHAYWMHIDATPASTSSAGATGLGRFGSVTAVEAPHTEENYLTREMGFVLARKHSARLRIIAILLFAAVPLIATLVAMFAPPSLGAIAAIATALAVTAGVFIERWLFFAEAKHVVMLYY